VNYLAATGLAVEAAVVHNFLWHRRFTWADRASLAGKACQSEAWKRLFRFQLSNGGISLLGNLLLVRSLVAFARVSLWLASLASIALCFCGNFLAGDQWVFSENGESVCAPKNRLRTGLLARSHEHQRALRKGHIEKRSRDT